MTNWTITISLFKFVCPIAAIAPKIIEAIDIKTSIDCHWSIKFINGVYKNLINTDKAAILGSQKNMSQKLENLDKHQVPTYEMELQKF